MKSMNNFFRNLLSTILVLNLCACQSVSTTTNFSELEDFAVSKSKPISLSFKDNKDMPFYFLLSKSTSNDNTKLIVRWVSPKRGQVLLDKTTCKIRFLLDNTIIISLLPISPPKIVSYNLNNFSHEEEAVFLLNKEQLYSISTSKNVVVELSGKRNTLTGYFNRYNTTRGFQDFLKQAYH
jgi:hypothetical protein